MTRNQSLALAALVAIVAIGAGMLLSRMLSESRSPALASGTLLTPPRPLPPVELTDHHGQAFGLERLEGRWSLMFFGFTHCPDICPQTLGVLAQVEKRLADLPQRQRPQVLLVSVDPGRDTLEQLASYVAFFSPSFTGLTAAQSTLDDFTRAMGAPTAITPFEDGGYTVDHSAAVFAINPSGALRALFSPPHSPQALAEDVRRLI